MAPSRITGFLRASCLSTPGVHAPGRAVTERIARVASSPLASVAGQGASQSPQALLTNVADAISFLALTPDTPPIVVHHPWEGLTAYEVMKLLGNREPFHVPDSLARGIVRLVRSVERVIPSVAPNRRRLEVLWFGQGIDRSWLEDLGWEPERDLEAWHALARRHLS